MRGLSSGFRWAWEEEACDTHKPNYAENNILQHTLKHASSSSRSIKITDRRS